MTLRIIKYRYELLFRKFNILSRADTGCEIA
jgi:hypothetical protein